MNLDEMSLNEKALAVDHINQIMAANGRTVDKLMRCCADVDRTNRRLIKAVVVLFVLLILAVGKIAIGACPDYTAQWFTSPGGCLVDPGATYVKAYSVQTVAYHGAEYLVVDIGDQIELARPRPGGQAQVISTSALKWLRVGGDAEHTLYVTSVQDDTRYVFLAHRGGLAIVDLGIGADPRISYAWFRQCENNAPITNGGAVWSHGGHSYLVTGLIDDDCPEGLPVYQLDGHVSSSSPGLHVGCMALPLGAIAVEGAIQQGDALYVAMTSDLVYRYRLDGPVPTLESPSWLFRGGLARQHTFDFDGSAVAYADTTTYRVTVTRGAQSATIVVPPIRTVFPSVEGPRSLELSGSVLWVDGGGTYDVSDLGHVRQTSTWLADWYQTADVPATQAVPPAMGACLDRNPDAAAMVGSVLYRPRFVVGQSYDLSRCAPEPVSGAIFGDGFESGGLEAWR